MLYGMLNAVSYAQPRHYCLLTVALFLMHLTATVCPLQVRIAMCYPVFQIACICKSV